MDEGCIYEVNSLDKYAISHAMIPTPIKLSENLIRVYYSGRDAEGIGRPRYVDFDFSSEFKVVKESSSIVLDIGRPGTFDDNGVVACDVLEMPSGDLYMYYAGFELSTKIRYRIFTGLAISKDGGDNFLRYSEVPILDRSNTEPFFRGGPFVKEVPGGYEMYYVGGGGWIQLQNSLKPIYTVKKIFSQNAIDWTDPIEVLQSKDDSEHGFGRPFEFEWKGRTFLYFSVRDSRHETYKISYAEIVNGQIVRKDSEFELHRNGLLVENHELMYAAFFEANDDLFMLYNTREFGIEGIFLARLMDLD